MTLLLWSLALCGLIVAGWLLHRLCIHLEDAGYMYYRKRGSGGGSPVIGTMMEVDKITRPTVQHVIEAREQNIVQAEWTVGDDPRPFLTAQPLADDSETTPTN